MTYQPNRIFHNHKISCIDFLLLSILENPGQSQRFHTRRLFKWQHGFEDHHSGGTNIAFFNNKEHYRDILFTDVAPKTVPSLLTGQTLSGMILPFIFCYASSWNCRTAQCG